MRPGENDDKAAANDFTIVILGSTVVCRSDKMAFGTALLVDHLLSLIEHVFPLSRASNNLDIVDVARSCFHDIVRKRFGIIACSVRDTGVDSITIIGVSIFVEGNADEGVRRYVLIAPSFDFFDETVPVIVVSLHDFEDWSAHFVAPLDEEHELVVACSDVLG